MATMEGDRALGQGQFRAGLFAMLEATARMHSRGDREISLDTGMASVWEAAPVGSSAGLFLELLPDARSGTIWIRVRLGSDAVEDARRANPLRLGSVYAGSHVP